MREFFKPWSRRIGVLTLVFACVTMVGWLRSVIVADSISWTIGRHADHSLMSAEQNLVWQTDYHIEQLQFSVFPRWQSSLLDYTMMEDPYEEPLCRWRFLGFEAGNFPLEMTDGSYHAKFLTLPYGAIVIPVTAICIWLFPSKGHFITGTGSDEQTNTRQNDSE